MTRAIRGVALLPAIVLAIGACQPVVSPAPSAIPSAPPGGTPDPNRTPDIPPPIGGASPAAPAGALTFEVQTFPVHAGTRPHDVAPASNGGVWYTAQNVGALGWLDPATGDVHEVPLGAGSAPHGVVSGPDGAAWVTDQGLDAIVRVTPGDFDLDVFPAPDGTSPHTAAFDHDGILWFTGAAGYVGRLDPGTRELRVFDVPRGGGPYGITVTPSNGVFFVSLQASYLGAVNRSTGHVTVIEPPTPGAGTRRVWSDSSGRLWISYWNAGMLAVYDPATTAWRELDLPGGPNMAYSVYVDELDAVWLSDFGTNSILRFDPVTETFLRFESDRSEANVRQMLGRDGEAWGAESGVDRLIVIRYAPT